jgi:ABC-2 type transport system permease protein
MNILKRELRAGLKPFVLWMVGVFLLVFIGIMKFEGVSAGGADVSELLSSMPRVLLAVLGMTGVDINTLGGYTSILFYYVLICAVVYSVHLGSSAVSRESVDKTYEFLFTKPCTRGHVLAMKLTAAWIYLLLFCVFSIIFSVAAVSTLKSPEDITAQIILFSLSLFLIGSLFLALSAFLSAVTKRPEKGSLYGNLAFSYAFILGVVYDMLDNAGALRLISPFKYFPAPDILEKSINPVYAGLALAMIAGFTWGAFVWFRKKDLT